MTSVAGGCMPICHGLGSAAPAMGASAATPTMLSMSASTALAVVFVVNNLVNRTMRLQPFIRYERLADPPAGFGRAAKPSESYTEARPDNNRVKRRLHSLRRAAAAAQHPALRAIAPFACERVRPYLDNFQRE